MCGLTGIYHLDGAPVDFEVLEAMNHSLIHRGPDDQGLAVFDTAEDKVWPEPFPDASGNLGLASRRLAILDLSPAGRMPMTNEQGTIWLVFNGEIYNYRELRTELAARGHTFRTGTDTETIIHAYEEWGPDCLGRFNGMWALALYDSRKTQLFCARDRLGVKPFYYWYNGRTFVFGSEIKALLACPNVPRRPDYSSIFNYLARSYRFVDGRTSSFFQGIRQILPGRSLTVSAKGLEEKAYWGLDPENMSFDQPEREYARRFLEILEDSVRLRLRSDAPVACQLSGGLDSSAVAGLAARGLGPGLPVFSAGYDLKPFDESDYIRSTADFIKANTHFIFPRPDDLLSTLPGMIRQFDEPVCTVTFYAHWQVMAAVARLGFKVILDGHGADELAAGYYDHFLHHFADLRAAGANGYLDAEVEAWLNNHGRERARQLEAFFALLDRGGDYLDDYLKSFSPYEAALDPEFARHYACPPCREDIYPNRLANRLYHELRFETLPAVLKADDRVTMAHSLESRHPFLDHRLVEFMFSLPNVHKIRHGLGKYVQRQALAGLIPEEVRLRKEKVGFNAPSERWFREEIRTPFLEAINSVGIFRRGFLNHKAFEGLFAEHLAGRANHYQFLWQVLNLSLWWEEYFGHA
ncbi:MAG: asparagine synthase (glutamine-hydrolyzing) [Thermodesulfobacteriota bacterium]